MFNYIIQNFNWPTFFLALAVFVLVSSFFNFLMAKRRYDRARAQVAKADLELAKMQATFRAKQQEIDKLLAKKERK
jgi:cell division protein FtsB